MAASVTLIYICPKCDAPMIAPEKPKRCPACGFKFNSPTDKLATKLEWHKAPSRQLFEIIQQETEKSIPKDVSEMLPNLPKDKQQEIILNTQMKAQIIKQQWEQKRDEFFKNTVPDDIEELVQCLHFLMSRSISSGNKELILRCQIWAQKFAEINNFLSPFVKYGGNIYDKIDQTTQSGDTEISK